MHRVHAAKPGMMRRGRCVTALTATAALAMAASPALATTSAKATMSSRASVKSPHAASETPGASNRRPLPASKRAGVAADLAASALARRLGRNVTVTSQTTATSMTVAHPDGTFTATMYALPVRTKVRGRWMPVSTRLARTRSGWSPGAVPSRLTFSPGGTRPLVTMASPHGSLALHLPVRLPAPRIRGGTATYRNVLPGVSLSLTATTLGGVTLTFRVASVRAAASPALRHLHLTVTTRGLTARTDRTGNFAAVARGLGPVFSGPAAISWDSPATAGHHVAPASAGAELHPALHGSVLRINPDSALLRPASRYPAYISQSLTPDFPVRTIRPGSSSGVSPDTFTDTSTAGRANFLETQQGCPTSQNYDITQGSGSEAGNAIGYNFWSSCIGIYRSYYSFNVSASSSAWHVIAATLSINQTYSADLTCGDKWPITVYNLGNGQPFGSGSDWSNYQPSMTSTNQVGSTTVKVGEPACPDNSASFGIASTMQSAANANAGDWSFGFRGNETKNPSSGTPTDCATQNCGYGRWSNNPKIVTTFDESPPSPSAMTAVPTPTASPNAAADNGCGTTAGTGGWIGKTDIANNSSTADLKATFSASLASEDVQGKFNFWEETPSLKATSSTPGPSGYVLAPATISEPVGITLIDGASYQWNAVATVDGNGNDGGKTFSTTSTDTCGFRVDETAPAGLTVSSSAFPPLGSVPGTTLTTGDTGQFNFTGYDPIPTAGACSSGGCLASNVYEFEYELNSAIPTSIAAPTAPASCPAGGVADGQLFGVAATNPAGTSSNPATGASCPIKIGNWGENTLFVAAVDNAGNISQTFQYHFYVPWSGAAPVAGDVNGDGFPDLLAASSNGDLLLFPGRTDPTATPQIASTPAHSPVPGTGWNNFQITHRGSFSQFPVDDVFALRGAILYRYLNNTQAGTTPQFENTANAHIVNWPSCPTPLMETDPDNSANCTGYPTGWSQISQIVAPGDAWVGANPFSASTFGTQGITQDDGDPSLLAVSKSGQLWLFQGNGGGQLQDPIQLGASGWSNMTVIAPGTVNGTTVLWARDNSTGTLYSYPFVISANKVPTLNPTTPSSPIPAEGTGTTGTAISGAPTLTKAAYPTLTAALPLATGTGGCATGNPGYYCAGLYAIDSSGNIWYYSGQPGTSPISSNRQLYFSALSPSGSWQLNDGGACTTAADTSGNGNTGTLNGGATCSADPAAPATEPNPPTVDSFDGSTGYVSTNSPALATGSGNSFSVSAWVYLTTNTQWATAVSQDTSASDSGGAHNSSFKLMYRLDTNSWVFARPAANTTGSAVDYASSAALTSSDLNTWTQLTGTYNASTGLETLYVNGQQVGTTTDTTPFASTGSTVIGRDLVDGSQSDFFPGDIKDVQVYSYSLSAAQAEALYQAPAASLPLNGPDSTGVLADGTGDGYSATPGGGVTYPVDKYFGTVTDLDGSSGYAETPASAGPVIDTTHSFTVSAWAKLPAIPTHNSTIVSEQGNVNSSFYLQFNNAYDGNNRWAFVMAATDATGTGMYNAISAPGTVQTNTWTQLTGVYNSATGTAQLYVNGQFAASVSAAGFASVGPLDIGRALWAGNLQDYFPGEVTEVQAFPYALSPGAVDALYLGQAPISQIG